VEAAARQAVRRWCPDAETNPGRPATAARTRRGTRTPRCARMGSRRWRRCPPFLAEVANGEKEKGEERDGRGVRTAPPAGGVEKEAGASPRGCGDGTAARVEQREEREEEMVRTEK
jgi:hypothetical protein